MRIAKVIFSVLATMMVVAPTLAQIRIIPQAKRDSVANPPTLKCEDMLFAEGRTIDFGSMAEDGGNQKRSIRWQNVGKEPIAITRIATSCGCIQCDYENKAVGGGESGEISILYAPKGHPGVMRQRVFIYTDRSAQMPTTILDIKGVVRPSADRSGNYPHTIGALLLRNRTIRFDLDEKRVQTMRLACMNGGKVEITPRKDNLLSSPSLTLVAEPATLRAGEEGEIVISYTPSKDDKRAPLRLFVENGNLPPRDREIKIITKMEKR